MKKYAFFLVLLIVVIILIALGRCSAYPDKYPFENRNEQIKQIDLLYYPQNDDESKPYREFRLIRTLEPDEIPEFMEEIYSLETKYVAPPRVNYGQYIARVYYENGDVENFASRHIEFVKAGEQSLAQGIYYFPGDAFDELFLEYAEKQPATEPASTAPIS